MKKSKFQIALFDDELQTRDAFYRDLFSVVSKDKFDIKKIDTNEFKKELEIIQGRQKDFRNTGNWGKSVNSMLDEVSILVIDYDLFDAHPFLKGSEVSYLARCFTTCGLIITINEAGHNPFDLTLTGNLNSFSDLHLGQDQLSSPYLWGKKEPKVTAKTPSDLYPWQWPDLVDYYQNYERKIEDVLDAIKKNISIESSLGFDKGTFNSLARSVSQFIGDNASDVTYTEFVASESGLEFKDRQIKNGADVNPIIVARVCAARIAKWLEYSLLTEQDILVDAPHLVSRLPEFLIGDSQKIATWNGVAKRGSNVKININNKILRQFKFEKAFWISRPVWFWRKIMEDKSIDQVREPWNISYPKWMFCEDASAFSIKSSEFVSKAQSSYARRYACVFDSVDYEPRNRFSL